MIGLILGNRYEIIKEIGCGGMAKVYLAHCRKLNRDVAIKIPKPEFAGDKEFLDRFIREAQSAAAISCPNIVGVYDVGRDGDINYIVMEYVEGETLKDYIDKHGMLSWRKTVDYAIKICKALDSAHKQGIIHRDIKPQNIIITKDGTLKVTDFGIARASSSDTVNMGESTMGSVHYFSPEQARGGYTDAKSDIYSLGVVMYEMITAHLPFDGDTPVAIAIKHIQGSAINPKEYNVSIPLAVEEVIKKAMAKEQRLRYQTAEEMMADLNMALNFPDEIPNKDDNIGDTMKFEPISDNDIPPAKKMPKEIEITVSRPKQQEPVSKPKQQPKKGEEKSKEENEKASTKKAVLLAIVSALAILCVVSVLGFMVFGGCSKEIKVPNLVGMTYEEALEKYKDEKFEITVDEYVDDTEHEAGYILSQTPDGGMTTRSLDEIRVKVVKDSNGFTIGDFAGKTVKELKEELEKELKVYKVTIKEVEEDSGEYEKGQITRTNPDAGSKVKTGSTLTVYVSSGGEKMPDLIGCTLEVAKKQLERMGLELGKVTPSDNDESYVVIYQSIDPDTVVEKGETVDFELKKTDLSVKTDEGKTSTSSKNITIVLPQDSDVVNVRVVQDGKVIHNQAHNKSEGSFDLTISGSGSSSVDIYFNGTYSKTVTVAL